MKEIFSFFLLKNSMRKAAGIRTFCSGDSSTSTLNNHHKNDDNMINNNINMFPVTENTETPTLEDMIFKLDVEEDNAERAKMNKYYMRPGRLSCVNNSDHILMSARNALNHYPRFSLDGKDAMYRSSFRDIDCSKLNRSLQPRRKMQLPPTLGGEKVVWCKPGVVAKLMGLEAMPVSVNFSNKQKMKRHNIGRRAGVSSMDDTKLRSG